jgi:hypothetical protein
MTDFSDESDAETHCAESYDSEATEEGRTSCLIDCATTHAILKEKRFFVSINASLAPSSIKTVGGRTAIAKGAGQAEVSLPNGTVIKIERAIYAPQSSRNLLGYTDLRLNGYHIHTSTDEDGVECLHLINSNGVVTEKFETNGSGLYVTHIEPTANTNCAFFVDDSNEQSTKTLTKSSLWHDRLGHPSPGTLRKMTKSTLGIPAKTIDLLQASPEVCPACAMGKTPNRKKTAFSSEMYKPHGTLEMLVSDVCGPIVPRSGPFSYFMIIKDMSSRYSSVQLLTSRNEVMPKLLTAIIQLKAHFPEHSIKSIRVDNASEYVSKSFRTFCASSGITLETSVPYAHNTSAENFVKLIQLIARPLLLRSNLPLTCWGHAVTHAGELIKYRPSAGNQLSPYELVHGFVPSVGHLKIFGSAVYVPIPPHQRTKFGPKRQLGIYVGCQSNTIIRYLNIETGDLFIAHMTMCEFDETMFPKLGPEEYCEPRERFTFDQPTTKVLHRDPYDGRGEKEVRRILHLNRIAQQMPDVFVPSERVTRSDVNEATNFPARVGLDTNPAASAILSSNKRGRPKGAKDLAPRKRRSKPDSTDGPDSADPQVNRNTSTAETAQDDKAEEASGSAFLVLDESDSNPQTIACCRDSRDWPEWKTAIATELRSLAEREVFGQIQECPPTQKPIGCRWVFTKKKDQYGNVSRFKARLVAQGFTQQFGVDYSDTYSPVMTMTTFRWLLAFAARNDMKVKQADIETAYLYGVIDTELYMKVPDGLRVEGESSWKRPCVKLHKSLYGLKQAGRIWYLHFSRYLVKCGFQTHDSSPCLFAKRSGAEVAIIGIYVDDIVMVGTDAAIEAAMTALKANFKVKDLGMIAFCLGVQVRQIPTGIVLYQANYIAKLLERFSMRQATRAARTPMVVRNLKPESDVYGPRHGSEEVLSEKYPFREAIGGLMYLANCSRPDIAFAVSVLARYSSEPTKRHWSGVKQVLRYLAKTKNYGLLYRRGRFAGDISLLVTNDIAGYADAGYLSDPHKARSQSGYVFMSAGAAISWKSTKQTIAATSTNQSEIIALYEACRECVWFRQFIEFVRKVIDTKEPFPPITVYEDNSACVTQVQHGYIRSDRTKHIDPKFFFMHELNKIELEVKHVASERNLADLFTKSLGTTKHWDLTHRLGMTKLQ